MVLAHADFGDPECCGLLAGIVRGDVAEITCYECGVIVKTVPAAELQKTLDEMESTLEG